MLRCYSLLLKHCPSYTLVLMPGDLSQIVRPFPLLAGRPSFTYPDRKKVESTLSEELVSRGCFGYPSLTNSGRTLSLVEAFFLQHGLKCLQVVQPSFPVESFGKHTLRLLCYAEYSRLQVAAHLFFSADLRYDWGAVDRGGVLEGLLQVHNHPLAYLLPKSCTQNNQTNLHTYTLTGTHACM